MAHPASDVPCRPGLVRRCAAGALIAGLLGAAPALAASDVSEKVGIWTLAVDGAHRMCRLNLRADPAGAGWGLAMPPGCRRAVPSLKDVQAWSMPSEGQLSLDNAEGQTVMMFDQQAGGLHGIDPQGEGLSLTPLRRIATAAGTDSGSIVTLRTADPSSPPTVSSLTQAAAAVAKPTAAPVSVRDAAGRYAVLRGDRDTGCMVTLDGASGAGRSVQKAHLAPACRDQGIIIFDPLGWQLVAGRLVLTARKGHTIQLDRTADGGWVKDPGQVKTLGLKPL